MQNFYFGKKSVLAKNQHFLAKIVPLLKPIVWELCLGFLVLFSVSISFTDYASEIRLPDCSKLAVNQKNQNVTISQHNIIISFFQDCFISLVKFSYWSKFHVNIITGSGVRTILFCKGLTRNLELKNILACVFPNIWRLGQVRDTKFGTNVSNKILLNAAQCQGYSFYHFWVIKEKPTGGKIFPPRLELKQADLTSAHKGS